MPSFLKFSLFKQTAAKAQKQAGPRYTPGLSDHEKFPSIQITELVDALDGLARNSYYENRWITFYDELKKQIKENVFLRLNKKDYPELHGYIQTSTKLSNNILKEINKIVKKTRSVTNQLYLMPICELLDDLKKNLTELEGKLYYHPDREKVSPSGQQHKLSIKDIEYYARELSTKTNSLRYFINSNATKLFNSSLTLILGQQGSGKTHFLCDYAKRRLEEKAPTILILAQDFDMNHFNFWENLKVTLKLNCTKTELIKFLRVNARISRTRILIIIDAINESDRKKWKTILKQLLVDVKKYKEIAIVLSCRTPFERVIFSKKCLNSLNIIQHYGFTGRELVAQEAFFGFYHIPTPEVPLLAPEFSNPLFLKIFCETIQKAAILKTHKRITDISSGQEGMTNIFEDYVCKKQKDITSILKKAAKGIAFFKRCDKWIWNGLIKEMANNMAKNLTDYISDDEFNRMLEKYLIRKKDIKRIKFMLINEGILSESIKWNENDKPCETIKFSYQKLSDHLIARSILHGFQFTDDNIKKLLLDWAKLPNILDALIIEFPKRKIGDELLRYYSDKGLPDYLVKIFIGGLYWRDKIAFNKHTNHFVGQLLKNEHYKNDILEVIFSLASKPEHVYNFKFFSNYLRKMTLPERDLFWTEFIRLSEDTGSVNKLVTWINVYISNSFQEIFAKSYLVLLSWLLTTTIRDYRNEVTKAIFKIGCMYPDKIFNTMQESLSINDPYISERMLAAVYGCAMKLSSEHVGRKNFVSKLLCEWAKWIARNILDGNGKYSTVNIRILDYASGILELGLYHKCVSFSYSKYLKIKKYPFNIKRGTLWEDDRGCLRELNNKSKPALEFGYYPYIHMDSAKYILSGITTTDKKKSIFAETIAKATWKIKRLGWSKDRFGTIDSGIERYDFYRASKNGEKGKIDRYGKKYFWITYYELAGHYQTIFKNGGRYSWYSGYQGPPTHRDIDPSFPSCRKDFFVKRNFLTGPKNLKRWMEHGPLPNLDYFLVSDKIFDFDGRWVLVNGYITQNDSKIDKQCFEFIRGFIFKKKDIKSFLAHSKKIIYPGNRLLPDAPILYEIFGGEIPWSKYYLDNKIETIKIPIGKKIIERKVTKFPEFLIKFYDKNPDEATAITSTPLPKKQEIIITKNFNVELPVTNISITGDNPDVKSMSLISKNICKSMKLSYNTSTGEFFDNKGRRAGFVTHTEDLYRTGQILTFIRKEILDAYLGKNKNFLWYIWGERRCAFGSQTDQGFKDVYKDYNFIHKNIRIYKNSFGKQQNKKGTGSFLRRM